MNLKTIKADLKKAKWGVSEREVLTASRGSVATFTIDDRDAMVTCCGVEEVGGFNTTVYDFDQFESDGSIDYDQEKEIYEVKKDSLVYKGVLYMIIQHFMNLKLDGYRNSYGSPHAAPRKGIKTCRPILFVTNGEDASAWIEAALELIPEHFIKVRQQYNPSRGNLLTIWVSK